MRFTCYLFYFKDFFLLIHPFQDTVLPFFNYKFTAIINPSVKDRKKGLVYFLAYPIVAAAYVVHFNTTNQNMLLALYKDIRLDK